MSFGVRLSVSRGLACLGMLVAPLVAPLACVQSQPCRPGTVFITVEFTSSSDLVDGVAMQSKLDNGPWTDVWPPITRPAGKDRGGVELRVKDYATHRKLALQYAPTKDGERVGEWTSMGGELGPSGCSVGTARVGVAVDTSGLAPEPGAEEPDSGAPDTATDPLADRADTRPSAASDVLRDSQLPPSAAGGATGTGGMVGSGGSTGSGGTVRTDAATGRDVAMGSDGPVGGGGADVDPHGGAKRWIEFGHSFVRCTWFTADQGFCSKKYKSLPVTMNIATDLYRTDDGGRTWSLVATIDGKNTSSGSMAVHVFSPTDMWFITGMMGFGFSGTIGRSTNGGTTWVDLTDTVHRALADDPDAGPPLSAPFYELARVGNAIWANTGGWSQYLAMSPDGGATWRRVLGPLSLADVQAPQLIATKSNLLLFYKTRTYGVSIYRLAGNAFGPAEGTFPAPSGTDHSDTWWRASVNTEAVTFADQRPWSWWGWPFRVSATLDGGRTYQTVYAGTTKAQSGCVGLRDALVVDRVAGSATYISGVFLDASNNLYDEIRKSTDGGATWTVLHSEPDQWNHTSVSLDPSGKVHAMRHSTDPYGNEYNYEAQYMLE